MARRIIVYRLVDPRGNTVEVGRATIEEVGQKAAAFIKAQATEGLAGSIDFTGASLPRRRRPQCT
jgi:hypothetical protein